MAVVVRRLSDDPQDNALGLTLVDEYVAATAAEDPGTGEPYGLEAIRPLMPDLDDFAGTYHADGTAFIVASVDDVAAGGVGLIRYDDHACEMKRLWVREPFRSLGIARRLSATVIDLAVEFGYGSMLLDVVPHRTSAIALYRSLGFVDAAPFHEYPFAMVPMRLELRA